MHTLALKCGAMISAEQVNMRLSSVQIYEKGGDSICYSIETDQKCMSKIKRVTKTGDDRKVSRGAMFCLFFTDFGDSDSRTSILSLLAELTPCILLEKVRCELQAC